MIYATNIQPRQILRFPIVFGAGGIPSDPILEVRGTTSLCSYEVRLDAVGVDALFFTAAADLRRLPEGEYKYNLQGVSEGLLIVQSDRQVAEYLNPVHYEQFNAND